MSFGSEIYNEVGRSLGFDPPYSFDQIKKIRECISEGFYRRNKIKEGCRWSHGEYEDVTMEDLKNLIIKHGLRERLGLAMTPNPCDEADIGEDFIEHLRKLHSMFPGVIEIRVTKELMSSLLKYCEREDLPLGMDCDAFSPMRFRGMVISVESPR